VLKPLLARTWGDDHEHEQRPSTGTRMIYFSCVDMRTLRPPSPKQKRATPEHDFSREKDRCARRSRLGGGRSRSGNTQSAGARPGGACSPGPSAGRARACVGFTVVRLPSSSGAQPPDWPECSLATRLGRPLADAQRIWTPTQRPSHYVGHASLPSGLCRALPPRAASCRPAANRRSRSQTTDSASFACATATRCVFDIR
jgi:hypothetical protein